MTTEPTSMTTAVSGARAIVPPGTWTELRVGLLAIVFAHACDLLTTYLRTPDLAHEVSPVYLRLAQLGYGGWPAMLAIKAVAVVLTAGLFVLYMRHRRRFYPTEAGMSFEGFLYYTHSKDAVRLDTGRWLAPSPLLLIVWLSFTGSIGSAAYSYFLAIHNLLCSPLMAWLAVCAAPAAIFLVTAVAFWRTLYNDYRRVVVA